MPTASLPSVPWIVTGNHWVSLPCIHPVDASLHCLGVLHRASRAAVEFAGSAAFLEGAGAPLLRPTLRVNGAPVALGDAGIAWERALEWLPTFTAQAGSLLVRGTIVAPCGRDADVAGALYAIVVENRGKTPAHIDISLEGTLGHRQQRVRTARPCDDAHRVLDGGDGMVVLEGAALPGLAAFALCADGEGVVRTGGDAAHPTFALTRTIEVAPGQQGDVGFYLAAGPERDGARATASVMRRRGWRDLLSRTRDFLRTLEQSTGHETLDRLISRNLLFGYFFAVGRALDDAHFYIVRSRAPWHAHGITVRDWEALAWTLPAIQLADAGLSKELLMRLCELHGYAPGQGTNYMDGTLFEPGFTLDGVAAYPIAVDRYIRDTEDDQVVEDGVIADTLYLCHDDLKSRRHRTVPLFATDLGPSGEPAPYPYTAGGNAAAAFALDVFRRTLDVETAKEVEDPEAVRAALKRHFTIAREGGKDVFAWAADLLGGVAVGDDPTGSLAWMTRVEAVTRDDSTYRRTMKAMDGPPQLLVQQCARLMGPDAKLVLQWLRRAPLDNGLAAEMVDAEGRAVGNGADASLACLLAYSVWYAVNAMGVAP